jgi:large subunit ribosomal protein L25
VIPRDGVGKGVARKLRSKGYIPAVLYGPEIQSESIAVQKRDLHSMFRTSESENILVDLTIEGKGSAPYKVIVREVQHEPVDGSVLHVDFQQISLTKKIHVNIPVHVKGTSVGVKSQGGILEFIHREVSVACLPTDIIDFFELDVSELNIGDSIHARDLSLPNLELLTNPNQVLVTVAAPTISKVAEEAAPVEGAEGEAPAEGEAAEKAEPEVITAKKKEDKAEKEK